MTRTGKLESFITSRTSRFGIAVATVAAAAFMAFGGLSTVGAQATGTYECGTYGGGNYDETDCTDTPASTGSSSGGSSSTGGSSSGSSSTGSNGSTGSSSGSSTGSSTGTGTTTTASAPLLNDFPEYTTTAGKSLSLKQGAVVNFNLKGTKYTITVKSADASSMVVTIASPSTDVTIPASQTVQYDADKDGTPDIAITYGSFAQTSATATAAFRSLAQSTSTGTTTGSETQNSTGGTTALPATGTSNLWWLWLIPVVIGVALLVGAIMVIRRRKAANNGGTTFNGPTF